MQGLLLPLLGHLVLMTKAIEEAVESFEGVPGRLQLIREVKGVKIYNDTTATTPEATIAALCELSDLTGQKKILIADFGRF
jgi:UDP-N-acetylmuramoylalanine-D-glutamate ligase